MTKPTLIIDGQKLMVSPSASDRSWHAHFEKRAGRWAAVDRADTSRRKRPGLQGPIDVAFMDSFVMAKPTGQPMIPYVPVIREMSRPPPGPATEKQTWPDRLVLASRRRGRRCRSRRRRRRRPRRARAPSASASATSPTPRRRARSAPGRRRPARPSPRWSRRRARRATYSEEPASSVSRAGQQPAGARLGDGDRPAALAQQRGDLLVDRAAVVGEQRAGVALAHESPRSAS